MPLLVPPRLLYRRFIDLAPSPSPLTQLNVGGPLLECHCQLTFFCLFVKQSWLWAQLATLGLSCLKNLILNVCSRTAQLAAVVSELSFCYPHEIVIWIYNIFHDNLNLSNILKNIWRGVLCKVLIDISPSNIFPTLLSACIFHQKCQTVLAAVSINGFRSTGQPMLKSSLEFLTCTMQTYWPRTNFS